MPLPAGYTRLPLHQFNLQKYLGTWNQYGSIRPWYQPHAKNVVLKCTQSAAGIEIDVQLEALLLHHHLRGKLTLGPILPDFTVHAPRALLGFGVTTDFTVKAAIVDPQGNYSYIFCARKGVPAIHVLARTREVPVAHQMYLREVIQELGYDLNHLQLS